MSLIDVSNLTINEDSSADVQVLLKTIEGMMNVINTQTDLYNDARKRLVEEHLKKPKLEISKAEYNFFGSPDNGPDLNLLREKLGILGARLKQMNVERANAKEQAEKAFKQLNNENSHLREELTRVRKILYSTNSNA